jgi:hypothetical protein
MHQGRVALGDQGRIWEALKLITLRVLRIIPVVVGAEGSCLAC